MAFSDFLDDEEKNRINGLKSNQPRNSLGQPVQSATDNEIDPLTGNVIYQQPQQQEDNGYIANLAKGAKANAAGVLGGQADFVSGTLGTDGAVGDYFQDVARNNARTTDYDYKKILSNPVQYALDPSGLAYDLGGGIGSSGVMAMQGAAVMAALPASVTTGLVGGLGAAAARVGLPWLGRALNTPAGKMLIGNVLKTPLEAASEGGNVYREMTHDEYGNPIADADKEQARRAMYTDAALNSAILTFTNSLESMGLGKLIESSGGKNKVMQLIKAGAWDFLQNGYEEGSQQGASLYSQGKGTARQILDPTQWNDEQRTESLIGGLTGFGQGAVASGAGMVANRFLGQNNQESTQQSEDIQTPTPQQDEQDQPTQVQGNLVDKVRALQGQISYYADDGTNCMRTMGIALAGTPYEGQINVDQAIATATQNGQLMDPNNYVPQPGDLAVVDDGNHIVMVTENGGTIQNGASHNGVYERTDVSPAQMFGGVKYYIRTSDYNGGGQATQQNNYVDEYLQSLQNDDSVAQAMTAQDPEGQAINELLQSGGYEVSRDEKGQPVYQPTENSISQAVARVDALTADIEDRQGHIEDLEKQLDGIKNQKSRAALQRTIKAEQQQIKRLQGELAQVQKLADAVSPASVKRQTGKQQENRNTVNEAYQERRRIAEEQSRQARNEEAINNIEATNRAMDALYGENAEESLRQTNRGGRATELFMPNNYGKSKLGVLANRETEITGKPTAADISEAGRAESKARERKNAEEIGYKYRKDQVDDVAARLSAEGEKEASQAKRTDFADEPFIPGDYGKNKLFTLADREREITGKPTRADMSPEAVQANKDRNQASKNIRQLIAKVRSDREAEKQKALDYEWLMAEHEKNMSGYADADEVRKNPAPSVRKAAQNKALTEMTRKAMEGNKASQRAFSRMSPAVKAYLMQKEIDRLENENERESRLASTPDRAREPFMPEAYNRLAKEGRGSEYEKKFRKEERSDYEEHKTEGNQNQNTESKRNESDKGQGGQGEKTELDKVAYAKKLAKHARDAKAITLMISRSKSRFKDAIAEFLNGKQRADAVKDFEKYLDDHTQLMSLDKDGYDLESTVLRALREIGPKYGLSYADENTIQKWVMGGTPEEQRRSLVKEIEVEVKKFNTECKVEAGKHGRGMVGIDNYEGTVSSHMKYAIEQFEKKASGLGLEQEIADAKAKMERSIEDNKKYYYEKQKEAEAKEKQEQIIREAFPDVGNIKASGKLLGGTEFEGEYTFPNFTVELRFNEDNNFAKYRGELKWKGIGFAIFSDNFKDIEKYIKGAEEYLDALPSVLVDNDPYRAAREMPRFADGVPTREMVAKDIGDEKEQRKKFQEYLDEQVSKLVKNADEPLTTIEKFTELEVAKKNSVNSITRTYLIPAKESVAMAKEALKKVQKERSKQGDNIFPTELGEAKKVSVKGNRKNKQQSYKADGMSYTVVVNNKGSERPYSVIEQARSQSGRKIGEPTETYFDTLGEALQYVRDETTPLDGRTTAEAKAAMGLKREEKQKAPSGKALNSIQAEKDLEERIDKVAKNQEKLQESADKVLPNTVELNAESFRDQTSQDYTREYMKKKGYTDEEIQRYLDYIDGIAEDVIEVAKRYADADAWQKKNINDQSDLVHRYRYESDKAKATGGLIPIRPIFKKNGEYPLNFDFGSLCVKREAMDAVMQILTAGTDENGVQLIQKVGPTQLEAIKSILKQEGYLVACDVCFVETKRARALNDANKWAFEWKSVLQAAGIDDNVQLGKRESLTNEQRRKLQEMAGQVADVDFKEAFDKYMPEDRRRAKAKGDKGADLDSGITSDKAKKIAGLILQDETMAGEFDPALLLTTEGTDKLFRTYAHTNIANTIAGMFGSATAKPLEGFNIYDNLSWYKHFDSKYDMDNKADRDAIYAIGGTRGQSFTDFNPVLFFDYVQLFSDLEIRQLPIHMYTKVPSLIELFGETGAMLNMSLVPDIVSDKAHAGLKLVNGKWEYAWAKESFDVDKAMEFRKRDEYGGRVGTIAVGVSDEHIKKMLDDENIDMIIPFHKSGMPEAVQIKTGLDKATDYTDYQETKKIPSGETEPSYDTLLHETGDPRKAAQAYLDWCKKVGATPKFQQFSGHKNYYKLLENFRGYDNKGNPVIQGPVKVKLPNNFKEILDRALGERQTNKNAIKELADRKSQVDGNKTVMERIQEAIKPQRLDGDARELVIGRLKSLLGKNNVVPLKKDAFLDALEEAYKSDMSEAEAKAKVEIFRTGDGVVKGFAKDGKIYLNEDMMNANTPAHEFSHIWAKVAQHANPELWKQGVELLKIDAKEIWDSVANDPLYQNLNGDENAIASEVLARVCGGLNEDFVRGMVDPKHKVAKARGMKNALYRAFGNKKGNTEEAMRVTDRLLNWVMDMFSKVRSLFSKTDEPLTYDEFIRMPLKTMYDEGQQASFRKNLKQIVKEGSQDTEINSAELSAESQLDQVRKQYEGTDQWMKAPNGEKTNLTEKQWLQVRTPAFKEWFGDWENDPSNASKIVDENGEPLVVYHGTNEEFSIFDMTKGRANMDIQGSFFSPWEDDAVGYGLNVFACYLNIRKPANSSQGYRALKKHQGENGAGVKAKQDLIRQGFDGVNNDNEEYIIFDSNSVKSATENTGDFSSDNDDIRYSARQEQAELRTREAVQTEIKKAFPNATFTTDNGRVVAELPNGAKFAVGIKDNIILNAKAQKRADMSHNTTNGTIQGYWKKLTGAGVDRLLNVSRNSEVGTAYHEAMHAAIDLALTEKEKASLYNYAEKKAKENGVDVEEQLADMYRDWVLARQKHQGTIFGKLWQKIKDLLTKVKAMLGNTKAQAEAIMQDVESGRVYERGINNSKVGGKIKAAVNVHGVDVSKVYVPAVDFSSGAYTDKIGTVEDTDEAKEKVADYILDNLWGENISVDSADFKVSYSFDNGDTYNFEHVAHAATSNGGRNKLNRTVRNLTISNYEDVLKNSVVVEINTNPKQHTGVYANAEHNDKTTAIIRSVMPIILPDGKPATLVITADILNGNLQKDKLDVAVYEISTKKIDATRATLATDGNVYGYSLPSILEKVNDLHGNKYVKDGKLLIDSSPYKTFPENLKSDREYMEAVKTGDNKTLKKLVADAAKEAGYTYIAYHGTTEGFNVFDADKTSKTTDSFMKGFYFTENADIARIIADKGSDESGKNSRVIRAYLKVQNPLVLTDREYLTMSLDKKHKQKILDKVESGNYDSVIILPFKNGGGELGAKARKYLLDNGLGKKTLLEFNAKGINGLTSSEQWEIQRLIANPDFTAKQVVVFKPNQIKSADAITYDKGGNIIPLAERFSEGSDDIRYSVKKEQPKTVTRQQLHSLAEDIVPIKVEKNYRSDAYKMYNRKANVAFTHAQGVSSELNGIVAMYVDNNKGISSDNALKEELLENAWSYQQDQKKGKKFAEADTDSQIKEGVAYFGRLYATDRDEAQAKFPKYFEAYEKALAKDKALQAKVNKYLEAADVFYQQSPEAKAKAGITQLEETPKTWKEKATSAFNQFYTDWFDDKDILLRAERRMEELSGEKISTEDSAYYQGRVANSSAASRIEMAIKGASNKWGKAVAKDSKERKAWYKALNEVYDGAWKNDVSYQDIVDKALTVDKDYLEKNGFKNAMQALGSYLLANRFTEIWETNPRYKASMSKATAEKVLANAPKAIKDAANLYYQFDENIIGVMHQEGMLSDKAYEGLQKYTRYCPLFRDFSDEAAFDKFMGNLSDRSSYINLNNGIKKLTEEGSDRTVLDDPVVSMVRMSTAILGKVERNKVAVKFVGLSNRSNVGQFVIPALDDKGKQLSSMDSQLSQFVVWENGEKKAYRTSPEIYEVLQGSNAHANAFAALYDNMFTHAAAKGLRQGATMSIGFMIRNFIRDTIGASINSKYKFIPFVSSFKGIDKLMSDEEFRNKFLASGAGMAGYFRQDANGIEDMLQEMAGNKWWQKASFAEKLKMCWDHYEQLGEFIENGARAEEFAMALEANKSMLQAAIDAKEVTLDFSRAGRKGREVNKNVPFFNAIMQGGDKMVRTAIAQPRKTAYYATSLALASMLLWAINHDDDWYKELDNEDKYSNWHFHIGDKHFKVPKPQEFGLLACASVEAVLEQMNGENPKAMSDWAKQFVTQMTPSFFPALYKPILECWANYDYYFNSPVVSKKYDRLKPEAQINSNTSEVARLAGQAAGYSPIKIDHLIRGYFGGAGAFVARIPNKILEDGGTPAKYWNEMPVINEFIVNDFAHAKSINDWYELKSRLDQEHATNGIKGKPAGYITGANKVSKDISNVRKQIEKVKAGRMDADQKRQTIDRLNARMLRIAQIGLKTYAKYDK